MVRSLFLPVSKVNETTTGRPVFCAAARARVASAMSLMVSTSNPSAPPSARAAACSSKANATRSPAISPAASIFPVGPMEANTCARPPAARREIAAPARLMAKVSASKPYSASETRLPRKVLVRMTRLPASTYERATSATASGRVRFQASGQAPSASPRRCSSVPQAPSVSTGAEKTSSCSFMHCHEPAGQRHCGYRVLAVAIGADLLGEPLGYGRAADHDLGLIAHAGRAQSFDGVFNRRHGHGEERREAHQVCLPGTDGIHELVRRNVRAEVDDFESAAFEHGRDDVLADIVEIAFHGAD